MSRREKLLGTKAVKSLRGIMPEKMVLPPNIRSEGKIITLKRADPPFSTQAEL